MLWTTEIKAVDPVTGDLVTYRGPLVHAPSWEAAHEYCQDNGIGYCKITGKFAYWSMNVEFNINNN